MKLVIRSLRAAIRSPFVNSRRSLTTSTSHILYERFLHAIDVLDAAYAEILQRLRARQQSETDVFELRCDTRDVQLLSDGPEHRTFHKIMVPEYLAWVDRGEDTLADSEWVAPSAYRALKTDTLTSSLSEELASKLNIV